MELFYNSNMEVIDVLFLVFISGLNDFWNKDNDGYWLYNFCLVYEYNEYLKVIFILGNVFNEEYIICLVLMEVFCNIIFWVDYKL